MVFPERGADVWKEVAWCEPHPNLHDVCFFFLLEIIWLATGTVQAQDCSPYLFGAIWAPGITTDGPRSGMSSANSSIPGHLFSYNFLIVPYTCQALI